jgi:hypothetical protein
MKIVVFTDFGVEFIFRGFHGSVAVCIVVSNDAIPAHNRQKRTKLAINWHKTTKEKIAS